MAMPKQLARYWAKKRKNSGKKSKGVSMATRRIYRNRRTYRRSYRRGNKVRLPMAVILGFTPLVAKGISDVQGGGFAGLRNTVPALIPYNPNTGRMDWSQLHWGLFPILGGIFVHKVAGMLGVNRMLGSMGIPYVRI